MIVTHRLSLISTLQDFIAERKVRLADLMKVAAVDVDSEPLEASLYIAECRAQSAFIRKLQDLLEEQQAEVRRAARK